jgi:hypothetical protein
MNATHENLDSSARPLRWRTSGLMDGPLDRLVLLAFFVIRILGSGTAQGVLARLGLPFADS